MQSEIAARKTDGAGLLLSALCILHCLATPFLATLFVAAGFSGSRDFDDFSHVVLLAAVVPVTITSARSAMRARNFRAMQLLGVGLAMLLAAICSESYAGRAGEVLSIAGSFTLVAGHLINSRRRGSRYDRPDCRSAPGLVDPLTLDAPR